MDFGKKKIELELETKLQRFQEHFIFTCGFDVFCTQYINYVIQIFLDDLYNEDPAPLLRLNKFNKFSPQNKPSYVVIDYASV
jgi:hypothetical protein